VEEEDEGEEIHEAFWKKQAEKIHRRIAAVSQEKQGKGFALYPSHLRKLVGPQNGLKLTLKKRVIVPALPDQEQFSVPSVAFLLDSLKRVSSALPFR